MNLSLESYNYKLFPSIDVSTRVSELKDFWFELLLKPSLQILLYNNPLFSFDFAESNIILDWYGDAAWLKVKLPKKSSEFNLRILCRNTTLIIEIPTMLQH